MSEERPSRKVTRNLLAMTEDNLVAGIPVDELIEEINVMAPAALEHAFELATSNMYSDEERALLLKIAELVRTQATHLLGVASASRRLLRLKGPGRILAKTKSI